VPADASSSIPSGLTVLGHADRLRPAETPHLLAYLATVTDPRTRTGRPLAIGVLGRAGPVNLAAALRHHARDPPDPWRPSGSPSHEPDITRGRRGPGLALAFPGCR
jgi:hypothetical protein